MFKWLSNYLANRKKVIDKEQYNNGFDYASGKLLRKESTPLELESYFFNTELDSFDRGVIGAINKLKEIGFIKKDYMD